MPVPAPESVAAPVEPFRIGFLAKLGQQVLLPHPKSSGPVLDAAEAPADREILHPTHVAYFNKLKTSNASAASAPR